MKNAAPENPYKFLDYFSGTEEDRRRFAGREREVREVVARITNERTLVLSGPSGIGKTSLLLAGVFPALEARGVRPVYVRTLSSPLADLCRALDGDCRREGPGEDLRAAVARAAADRPLVVVLDQFEELFLRFRSRPGERAAFTAALAGVVRDPALPLTVVFSLREDYLASLDELKPHLPDLIGRRYLLQPLTAFGVRQAVSRPLIEAGVECEAGVVPRLIALLDEVGFEPALLQMFCTELFRKAAARAGSAPVRLTVADVERLGGIRGVFLGYLNGVAEALPPDKQLFARMVLDALITAQGTKRAVRLAELPAAGFFATEEEARDLAALLVEQRILRRDEREGEVWYELIHDQLIPALREWLDADEGFSRFRQARTFVRNNAESEVWKERPDAFGSLEGLLAPFRDRFRFTDRELGLVVRNALYHESGQLAFWAERYGLEKTRGALLEMLASGREDLRRAGAASARHLPDDGSLAMACLRLALNDPSESVRREARASLAPLIREEERAGLRRARNDPDRDQRRRALRTYATLHGLGDGLAGAGFLDRFRARREHERRVLGEALKPAWSRAWAGAFVGALAGGFWILGQLGLAEGVRWVREPATFDLRLTWQIPVGGLLGLALGMMLGGLLAFAAAQEAALRGEGRWLAALVRRPWGLLGLALWMAIPVLLFSLRRDSARLSFELPPAREVAFLALASLLPVLTARGLRAMVWPGISRAGTCLAGLIISLGAPVLLMMLSLWAVRKLPAWEGVLAGRGVLFGYLIGALSLIALLSLAVSADRHPLGPVPGALPGRRASLTVLALAALVAVPVLFVQLYGVDRFLPTIADYEPEKGTFLAWPAKGSPVDPPLFEVRTRSAGGLKLEPAEGGCRPEAPEAAPGRLRRIWLKPDASGGRVAGWCVVPARP